MIIACPGCGTHYDATDPRLLEGLSCECGARLSTACVVTDAREPLPSVEPLDPNRKRVDALRVKAAGEIGKR